MNHSIPKANAAASVPADLSIVFVVDVSKWTSLFISNNAASYVQGLLHDLIAEVCDANKKTTWCHYTVSILTYAEKSFWVAFRTSPEILRVPQYTYSGKAYVSQAISELVNAKPSVAVFLTSGIAEDYYRTYIYALDELAQKTPLVRVAIPLGKHTSPLMSTLVGDDGKVILSNCPGKEFGDLLRNPYIRSKLYAANTLQTDPLPRTDTSGAPQIDSSQNDAPKPRASIPVKFDKQLSMTIQNALSMQNDILKHPRRLLAIILDLAETDAMVLNVLCRNCDEEMLAHFVKAQAIGTMEELQQATVKTYHMLTSDRGLREDVSKRIATAFGAALKNTCGGAKPVSSSYQ